MSVLTIREKNQVTLPQEFLRETNLGPGDPIEFQVLPDGGLAIYPYGHRAQQRSAWDVAMALAARVPGLEDVEFPLPVREVDAREVTW